MIRKNQITNKVPQVSSEKTVAEVKNLISSNIGNFETIDYIYILDDKSKLVGVLSVKELFLANEGQKIVEADRKKPLITATKKTSLEEIAYLILTHGIKAMPVVDDDMIFQGVLPHDVTTAIVHKELREDILQLSGVHPEHAQYDNLLEIPFFKAVRHRTPWLFIGLAGGLLAAQIIGQFEKTLEKSILLAAFIPLVVYIADAVGTQLEAFTIRDFALFKKINFTYYFLKQFLIVFVISLMLGVSLAVTVFLLYKDGPISVVLGLAIASASMSALFSGLLVPFVFRSLKVDPANASGPIGTIIQDVLSVSIYFAIATIIL